MYYYPYIFLTLFNNNSKHTKAFIWYVFLYTLHFVIPNKIIFLIQILPSISNLSYTHFLTLALFLLKLIQQTASTIHKTFTSNDYIRVALSSKAYYSLELINFCKFWKIMFFIWWRGARNERVVQKYTAKNEFPLWFTKQFGH